MWHVPKYKEVGIRNHSFIFHARVLQIGMPSMLTETKDVPIFECLAHILKISAI